MEGTVWIHANVDRHNLFVMQRMVVCAEWDSVDRIV